MGVHSFVLHVVHRVLIVLLGLLLLHHQMGHQRVALRSVVVQKIETRLLLKTEGIRHVILF